MRSIDLGALANFAEGKPERVTASDRALLVVRRGDAVYALRDLCPHQGARLSDGHLTGHVPACVPGDDIRMERTGEVSYVRGTGGSLTSKRVALCAIRRKRACAPTSRA